MTAPIVKTKVREWRERTTRRFYFDTKRALRDLCRSVRGASWCRSQKSWYVPATPLACLSLAETFDVTEAPDGFEDLVRLGEKVRRGDPPPSNKRRPPWPQPASQPWHHQQTATEWAVDVLDTGAGALLYFDMGTGKTRIVLDTIIHLGAKAVIVGSPLAVARAWLKQCELHYPGHFNTLVLSEGSVKERASRLRHFYRHHDWSAYGPMLIVVNYEAIWREPMGTVVREIPWDMAVSDESHRIKGRNSKQSHFFRDMAEYVPYRMALSGTPLSNGQLSDAFGQYCFLDPGAFGTSITRFEGEFAWKPPGHNFVARWVNQDEFDKRFWWLARYASKEDVLDLPEWMDETYEFDLSKKARRVYDDLEETFIADLGDGKIVWGTNAAVRVSKLQQVTSGSVLVEDAHEYVHDDRTKILTEILRDLGEHPAVVYVKYRADIQMAHRAAEAAGRESMELSGSVKQLEDWQDADGYEVLVVQIDAGSEGIDLTRSSYAVYFSVGYSLSTYQQSRARVHRPGQTRSTTFIHIIARGTVDEMIYRSIAKKQDLVEGVLEAYNERIRHEAEDA